MKITEIISEANIDINKGAGAVPYNADIDYFGLRVKMKPSTWLSLADELTIDPSVEDRIEKLAQYIKDAGAIGPPWYFIDIPDEWREGDLSKPAKISGHEGRHRMQALIKAEGDVPVEVHLVPRGGLRARDFTPEWVARLNKNIISQRGQLTNGPWFTANQIEEEVLDEMPLPADWDPAQMGQGTSFKARLAYALERAKKLGTGSSRVAMIIEYQGRQTVLKVAKNAKGLAQNSVEADILSDGYASQLGILIPIIDYDEQHREPLWIHTEMATKATNKQLCQAIGCDNLDQLVNMAWAITGKKKYTGNYQSYVTFLRQRGVSEEQIETMTNYANTLADLNGSFDVELGDFARAANWGIYQGKPVIIDVGFNSNVLNQYYK